MADIAGKLYPEFFQFPEQANVVNLGCGIGPQAVVYRGDYLTMVGVDISAERVERSLEIAKQLGILGYTGIVANVESTPLEANSADVVLAVDLAEHVLSPEKLMDECRRLLKSGGVLLATYPALHDVYIHNPVYNLIRRVLGRSMHDHSSEEWNPDHHNSAMSLKK